MIYGYIRVSSDKQTVENQRFEINNFCERERIKIDGWIEETISGTKAYDKRQLGKLLKRVQKDDQISFELFLSINRTDLFIQHPKLLLECIKRLFVNTYLTVCFV